jgi:hypothetical protein
MRTFTQNLPSGIVTLSAGTVSNVVLDLDQTKRVANRGENQLELKKDICVDKLIEAKCSGKQCGCSRASGQPPYAGLVLRTTISRFLIPSKFPARAVTCDTVDKGNNALNLQSRSICPRRRRTSNNDHCRNDRSTPDETATVCGGTLQASVHRLGYLALTRAGLPGHRRAIH